MIRAETKTLGGFFPYVLAPLWIDLPSTCCGGRWQVYESWRRHHGHKMVNKDSYAELIKKNKIKRCWTELVSDRLIVVVLI